MVGPDQIEAEVVRSLPWHDLGSHGRYPGSHQVPQWPGVRGHPGTRLNRRLRVQSRLYRPGSPWENGCCDSFSAKLRDELVDGDIFYSLAEARIVIESWR